MLRGGIWNQTRSEKMKRAIIDIQMFAAQPNLPILLAGESGVGKDEALEYAHSLSPRHRLPYHWVNCAALTSSLGFSQLFGHLKGSFSSAYSTAEGHLHRANGRNLYLAEVFNLEPELQAALLDALSHKRGYKVGSCEPDPYDFRLFAASARDLGELVRQGRVWPDFVARIATGLVVIPPLRERMEDLPLIANNLLAGFGMKQSYEEVFDSTARKKIMEYQWPGNIHELKAAVEKAVAACCYYKMQRCSAEHVRTYMDNPWLGSMYETRQQQTGTSPGKQSARGRRSSKWDHTKPTVRELLQKGVGHKEISKLVRIPLSSLYELTRNL